MTDGAQRTCPSCGHVNPADAQFCRECGAVLVEGRDSAKRASTLAATQIPPLPADLRPVARKRIPWIAIAAGIIAIFCVFFVYQRNRAGTSIPIPGAPPPADYPTIPVPAPTAEQHAERSEPKPAAPMPPPSPLESDQRREEARGEPPPAPPEAHVPRSTGPRPVERGEGRLSPRQPGWYRVAFDAPLFESPSETAPVLTRLHAGTRIRVTRVLPGFLAVESTTGKRDGYLSSDDALPESVAGPVR